MKLLEDSTLSGFGAGDARRRAKLDTSGRDLGIVAVGVAAGQGKPGVDLGPAALLGSGLVELLSCQPEAPTIWHDYTVHTYQDLGEPELVEHLESVSSGSSESSWSSLCVGTKRPLEVSHATQCLAQQVYQHASQGRTVLTLGGDHSIAIGSVAANSRACRERLNKDMAIVWVDAHADINTPLVSNSGNIHGMPLAFLSSLVKTGDTDPFGWLEDFREGHEAAIDVSKLVYIGLRDVEDAEQETLDKLGIKHFTNKDVQNKGIERVMNEVFEYVGQDTPIHLSFDIDSLDPTLAPSTGTPVAEGLTLQEGTYICRKIQESKQMISMDLVEVNPLLAPDETGENASKTVEAGLMMVQSAFGAEQT